MTVVLVIVVLVVVAVLVSAVLSARPNPLLEIARTQARHALEAELFEHRSRVRAEQAERAATAAMARDRGRRNA